MVQKKIVLAEKLDNLILPGYVDYLESKQLQKKCICCSLRHAHIACELTIRVFSLQNLIIVGVLREIILG